MAKVIFTVHGVGHYCTTKPEGKTTGVNILQKQWDNDDTDWGTWHFQGDLPLEQSDADGNKLMHVVWDTIEQ
jgi:hypothetical protein